MKKSLLLTVAIILIVACSLNAQTFTWAHNFGGTDNDGGNHIATDATGNTYVTGFFNGTATFGSTTLISAGGTDAFFAMYDIAGSVQWAYAIGGTGNDEGTAICVDPNGKIYVAGIFASPAITVGTTTLTNSGGDDIFFLKYFSNGILGYAVKAGGPGYEKCLSISANSLGRLYATGYVAGNGTACTFGSITITGTGVSSMFIAKYDAFLGAVWAQKAGGLGPTGNARGTAIVSDYPNKIFVAGRFSGGVDFVSQQFTTIGNTDMFLADYSDSSGTLSAAYQYYGASGAQLQPASIKLGLAAPVFIHIAGYYTNSVTLGTSTLTSNGLADVFLTKINIVGNVQWAAGAGGTADDKATSLAVDPAGNAYLSGHLDGNFNFGNIPVNGNSGTADVFVAKYNAANAAWEWVLTGGSGSGYEYANDIAFAGTNNLAITGQADAPFTLGSIPIPNAGLNDGFIAKINTLTGINDLNSENAFAVSPNPASTTITFTPQPKTPFTFLVYNYTGLKVIEVKNQTTISVATLPRGLYIAEVRDKEMIIRQKFVKE